MTINFVRQASDMLPEREPPLSQAGLSGWAYQNLWSSWTDRTVTLFISVILLWAIWSLYDNMLLRGNTAGQTQDVGTLATSLSEAQERLTIAMSLERDLKTNRNALIIREQRDLNTIKAQVERLDLNALPKQRQLGQEVRILPEELRKRIAIAKTKLPLSVDVRLTLLEHQLANPDVTALPDTSILQLSEKEQRVIADKANAWAKTLPNAKTVYNKATRDIRKILRQKVVGTDGQRTAISLAAAQSEIDAILENLSLDGKPIKAEDLMTGPLKSALQFNALPDGAVGTLITDIPLRIIKIRKDSLPPKEIAALRKTEIERLLNVQGAGLSKLALKQLEKKLNKEVDDAFIFLKETLPASTNDALPPILRDKLAMVGFWDIAAILTNPPQSQTTTGTANVTENATLSERGVTVSTESGGATIQSLIPRLESYLSENPERTAYLSAVEQVLAAYRAHDLQGMLDGYKNIEPLTAWADTNNGFNWAAINNNWQRILWGSYPGDQLWRLGIALAGFIIALLPLFVPRARTRPFIIFTCLYPILAFFLISGLAIRFYGFEGAEEGKSILSAPFSPLGRVIQAGISLLIIIGAWLIRHRTPLGKIATPALVLTQGLAGFYFLIMVWGSILNPEVATKDVLLKNDFYGLLSTDHPLAAKLDPANIEEEIAALNTKAQDPTLSNAQQQAARVEAIRKRTSLGAAQASLREFQGALEIGNGTFVFISHVTTLQWGGLVITMILGVVGMALSLPLGIVLAFARQSHLPIVSSFATGFIEVIRGVPLIALLLIVTFVLPKLLPSDVEYPKLALVVIAICIFGAAYQAEVIRGGLQSLPKGQFEAAQAMGLSFWQETRFITLPQAIKAVIPAIVNTFIGLFKDTTLVIVVGIFDILTVVNDQIGADVAWNRSKPEMLAAVALIFFVLMFSLSRYSMWLEQRLRTDHR